MAFSSFGNPSLVSTTQAGGVQDGADLIDIQTEALGFLAISGSAKVQLLPTPWPLNQLPPATSSLMSIASHKQLLAAAGPDAVILATTESVRKAFEQPKSGDGDLRPFQPASKLDMPMRISQLAFSADETYLVLSAENGGGLAVYETQALLNNSKQSAFELPTNGQSLRALIPNPTPEKAELFAVVTNDGNLLMANLKERNFVAGPNGQILKTGVSCVSWSTRGKQLVAGLADGTIHQLTPEGVGKGDIPRPPKITNGEHVSSISWLENNVFLTVHTPSATSDGNVPESIFHIVTRTPPSSFTFQKLIDPVGGFGIATRSTPHHSLLRLKDFPPNLQDMVIVSSTASTDIGLFTRSKVPLDNAKPAEQTTGVFTLTEMSDDSRRAQLPMAQDMTDTSPIGIAFDFSSKDSVLNPIPTDSEINESATPLPLVAVLNHEGVLAAWWVVYNDSVRQKTLYPGLVVAPPAPQAVAAQTPAQPAAPTFGAPTQSPSAFGAARPSFGAVAFGTPAGAAPFGSVSASGSFGAPSGLGQKASPWGTSTTSPAQTGGAKFGASTFGSTPAASTAPAFGSSNQIGNRASPWGTPAASKAPAFGESTAFGKPSQPFGSSTNSSGTAPSSGGFASFASGSGFAGAAGNSGTNLFGAKPTTSVFGTPTATTTTAATPSSFGALSGTSASPFAASNKAESKPFGSGGFVLGSTFKPDGTAKDDGPPPSNEAKNSFFGSGFSNTLGEAAKSPPANVPVSTETDMDTGDDTVKPQVAPEASTTPVSTPAAPKFGSFDTSRTAGTGLFGQASSSSQAPGKASAGFSFGNLTKDTPAPDAPKPSIFGTGNDSLTAPAITPKTPTSTNVQHIAPLAQTPPSPKVKAEPVEEPSIAPGVPSSPLAPDTTSKDSYAAGDTSNSSIETDAPLPPDFVPKKVVAPPPTSFIPEAPIARPITADMLPPLDVPGGPSSDEGSSAGLSEEGEGSFDEASGDEGSGERSDEGSGEDVANDLSPTSEIHQTPAFTPQQSFNRRDAPTPDTFFTKVQAPSLFGEVQKSAPVLPPPKIFASPRSPSPIRNALPGSLMRPDASRSVSAPGAASQLLSKSTKASHTQSTILPPKIDLKEEERRRAELQKQQEAEAAVRMFDEVDDQIQEILAGDLEPSKDLDEFVAHNDYVGASKSDSIPNQVETVYRDINSMVDTLGVNARALQNFMLYQTEKYKDNGREREDLEDGEDWVLEEVAELGNLVAHELSQQLEGGKIKNFAGKVDECKAVEKEVYKLRAKVEDIRRLLDAHLDEGQIEIARLQPLSPEQAAQQSDLRKELKDFQTNLSKAEQDLVALRAIIVSRSGKGNVPTVEAVTRTILSLTRMAEKKSGDVDFLEQEMKRLGFTTASGVNSRGGSPFTTPQKNRQSVNNFSTSSTSRFYTPDSSKDSRKNLRNSLMSSINSPYATSSPRKKLSGFTIEEKNKLKGKLARRKLVTDKLFTALENSQPQIRSMDDE